LKTERQDGLFLCFSLRVMRNSEDDTAHHCDPNQKGHKHTEMFFGYVHVFNSPSIHKRIVSKANAVAMANRFRFMGKPLLRCTSIRFFDLGNFFIVIITDFMNNFNHFSGEFIINDRKEGHL